MERNPNEYTVSTSYTKGGTQVSTFYNSYDFRLVGLQIRNFRESRNISQEQLAYKAGLSTGTIGKIERGINNPKTDTLLRIAHELDVPCQLFFEQIDRKRPHLPAHLQTLVAYAKSLGDNEIHALCMIAKIMSKYHDTSKSSDR